MRYLVTAHVKPGREAALLRAIESGALGAGSVAGDEYLRNMESARLCTDGSVKGMAVELEGAVLAELRLPTDLWTEGGVSELNVMQLEGQARAAVRGIAARLREIGRLKDWAAIGISATHHTAGRIDADHIPIRRAI